MPLKPGLWRRCVHSVPTLLPSALGRSPSTRQVTAGAARPGPKVAARVSRELNPGNAPGDNTKDDPPAPPTVLAGEVVSGRGVAPSHIRQNAGELRSIVERDLFPGSLNIILRTPVRLSSRTASTFSGGKRLVWPATLNGMPVWIYRGKYTVLHVIEILSDAHLRRSFNLHDGDEVQVTIDRTHLATVSTRESVIWFLFWAGRRHWVYTGDRYFYTIKPWGKRLGTTQTRRTEHDHGHNRNLYQFEQNPLDLRAEPHTLSRCQVQNLLNYTKISGTRYAAQHYPAGYHTIELDGYRLQGQRDPSKRLQIIPVDLQGKTVLDIGCNQGGMLFANEKTIKWGVGIDNDSRLINAANRIKAVRKTNNLDFYVFDLEKEPLELIPNFLPGGRVDVVFLLAVCMWLHNWKKVVRFAARIGGSMVFEANGSERQQLEQERWLKTLYDDVSLVAEASEDDQHQKERKLFYCRDASCQGPAPTSPGHVAAGQE